MHQSFYRRAAILWVMLLFCCAADPRFSISAAKLQYHNHITLIVRSSPDAKFEDRLDIDNDEIAKAIRNAKQEKLTFTPSLTDIYITVPEEKQMLFRLELSGNLWSENEAKRFILPVPISDRLRKEGEILRTRHYGEFMAWNNAEQIVPRKSIFSLQDLETGLTFRVQRRAGSKHADVQPLTEEDTKIMKQIYEGRWSWKRKAVLVHINGRKLAASMNGMPHGGDGIPGNGFSGHFCVHFPESTTHRSDEPDLAHQLLVHKAAGNQRTFFDNASPLLLAQSIIEAINLQDSEMLRSVTEGTDHEKYVGITRKMDSVAAIRILRQAKLDQAENLLDAAVELEVAIQQNGRAKSNASFQFIFNRLSPHSPWHIQDLLIT